MRLNRSDRQKIVEQIRCSGFVPEEKHKPKIENFTTGSLVEKEKELSEIKSKIRHVFIPGQIGKIFSSHEPGESISFYLGKELLYGTIIDLAKHVEADSRIKMKTDTITVLTERGVMNISPLQIRTLED